MIMYVGYCMCFFFFKQKTAYEMRIRDWSSDVCSSDLAQQLAAYKPVVGSDGVVAPPPLPYKPPPPPRRQEAQSTEGGILAQMKVNAPPGMGLLQELDRKSVV